MASAEKEFSLNPAQARNMRNWRRDELPTQAFVIYIPLNRPQTEASVRAALASLVTMHGALRSSIMFRSDGEVVQRVFSAADVLARLSYAILESPGASPASAERIGKQRVDPLKEAFRCILFVAQRKVVSVALSVSHVFTDGIGIDILARDFKVLLSEPAAQRQLPPQPEAYSLDSHEEQVRDNTEYWKQLLRDAPRSCTFAPAPRDQFEDVYLARVTLTDAELAAITHASRLLRVTPYAIWAAAMSCLVQAMTGQFNMVFRSTYANRVRPEDSDAVVQLAQAVFLPISGSAIQTLGERALNLLRRTFETYQRGMYDANALLDFLNAPELLTGTAFQPAFEINYLPASVGDLTLPATESAAPGRQIPEVGRERHRIDPSDAKAELAVQVVAGGRLNSRPTVRLWARRPVHRQRSASELLSDLLTIVRILSHAPETRIAELPVDRLPASVGLLRGHHSGVAFDPAITQAMLMTLPGVQSCALAFSHGMLAASLRTQGSLPRPMGAEEVSGMVRSLQPWYAGSLIPDQVLIE
jgi:hypothetical protein